MKRFFKLESIREYLSSLYVSKFEAFVMVFLVCLYAVAEFGGIGMLMPVLQYISEGPAVYQSGNLPLIWEILIEVTRFFRIPLNLATLLMLAFIPILLRQLFYYLQQSYTAKIRFRTVGRIRRESINQILKADLEFFLKQGQGNLMSAITLEAGRAGNLAFYFVSLLSSIVLLLLYGVLLLIIQPYLAVIAMMTFAVAFLFPIRLIRRSRKYSEGVSRENRSMVKQAQDRIYGIRLIKMFSQEKKDFLRIKKIINRITDFLVKADINRAKVTAFTEPLVILAVFIILYLAVDLFGMALANLGLFIFVLYRTVPHVKDINTKWQRINVNFHSSRYVRKIIEEAKASQRISSGSIPFEGLKHEIVFDSVSFSYEGNSHFVLKDISFRIPRGSFIAIVGPSGAGKSTLLDLIPRLRDVTSGEIRIDGVPIKEFDLKSLRSKIGFVTQEPFLFKDTIINNIAYGHDGKVSLEEVEKAARDAFAHEFIAKFPKGYNTVIGDRGISLSGGERQRLAMARVLLQNPEILLLDEPASALDSESERYIQLTLESLRGKKTIILVAHRLSTIKQADQILVLTQGRLVECGDFPTLFNKNGVFRKLFDSQIIK